MVSLIQILYSLNDNESSLSFDPSNKLKVFKNIVNLTQKINVDLFDIYYNDKIINAMDEARQETRERDEDIKRLQTFAKEVEEISADGQVTSDEITRLQEKIATLERQLRRVKKED